MAPVAAGDAVKAFVEHLALNRHLSPHSVRAYASDVEQYLDHTRRARGLKRADLLVSHLDGESVRAFVVELNRAQQA
ncbi:MAG: site-specific integrase, partial [Vicinamibacterales bacterium]